MGLGPSIKMTTLHHYRCPITARLSEDPDIDFSGIIVDGVSEVYDDKYFTAQRTADYAQMLRADGAIVAIDGWGNHHVDFVSVIEACEKRGIPCVGLSYVGRQGRLVCSNSYVDCVVDFNKCETGYESCVVGQNNLTDLDAFKAAALLKNKMRKNNCFKSLEHISDPVPEKVLRRLEINSHRVKNVVFGEQTQLKRAGLQICRGAEQKILDSEPLLQEMHIQLIRPEDPKHILINSNLDFSPIACKMSGRLGEGTTHLLTGITVMLTGAEASSGFQPSNIGSSEGCLDEQVTFDRAGTPASDDFILHVDVLFKEGEGRTSRGIAAAHRACDAYVEEIRSVMKNFSDLPHQKEVCTDLSRSQKPRVVLIKIVSGLGNMYDTMLFPAQPGGYRGGWNLRECKNQPWLLFPSQCRDGAIHSML